MSELDWLEREERYRTRISRTLVLTTVAAVVFFGTGFYVLHRQRQASERARQEADVAAAQAERTRILQEFAADSTAAAQRLITFKEKHAAQPLEGAPILLVPVPRGSNLTRFLESKWLEYARVVDPDLADDEARQQYHSHYVDVMNMAWYNSAGRLYWEGELRPTAILLPDLRQRGTELLYEKPSFPQVVRAQEEVGLRVIEEVVDDAMAMEELGDQPEPDAPAETPPNP